VVPAGTDIGALIWTAQGVPLAPAGQNQLQFRKLNTSTGAAVPVAQPAAPDNIALLPAGQLSLQGSSSLPAGSYQMGVSCFNSTSIGGRPAFETGRYFATSSFTVEARTGAGPNNFVWGTPAAPPAPSLSVGSVTSTGGVVNFTQPTALPAVSSYNATVTPAGGTAVVNAAAGTITLSDLTTGTTYSVSLTGTNTVGTGPVSNTVQVTPANATPPAPVASATSKAGNGVVSWTAPTSGPTPIGYSVVITGTNPVVAPQTITLGNVLTTGDVPLAVGDYSATVTATYAASEFITPVASAPVTFKSLPNALIEQEITVARPQLNALILTQRCGVNSLLPAELGTPLFPRDLADIPATTGPGAPPTKPGATPSDPRVPVTNFGEYPVPSTPEYPTRCGIDLANVQLVTSGALRGQYFTASGALNQVTVADFRDTDAGWTLTGTMGGFSAGPGKTFSGDYLGWTPATPIVSPPIGGYTQTVTQGAPVAPGTGVPGFASGPGLTGGKVLASAPVGTTAAGGTGIADLNARVKLLIPTTADSGTYKGILTFTVA
jgi:hypothetical protein